jgi:prepilin-type N-terminal cleavage/methylation domain-containing protein
LKYLKSKSQGFTIVELLIVIVIIGILATISIVTYNGVQKGAIDKTVLSDIDNVAGELTRYSTKNFGVYGSAVVWYSPSGTNTNINFAPTSGNIIDVVTNQSDYCIRAYNPNAATYKTLATAANKESTAGACTSLTASRLAQGNITNMVNNPSVEAGVIVPNTGYYSPPAVIDSSTAAYGASSIHATTNSTTNPQGMMWQASSASGNTQYTCSLSLKGTNGSVVVVAGRALDTSGNYIGEGYGAKNVTLSASWQRVSVSFTSPANTGIIYIQFHLTSALSGIDLWSDGAMCVTGTSTYNYADGSSSGWIWNGGANNSSSIGPAL